MDSARLACWTLLVALIAGLNYVSRFVDSGSSNSRDEVYSWSAFTGGMIVYAIWLGLVLALASGRPNLLALRRPRVSWPRVAGYMVTGLVAIYVVGAIVSVIPLPESPSEEQGLTPTHWEPRYAAAFAANVALFAIVAPFVEELMFRGVGQSLLQFLGRWPPIVLVGTAFGLSHGLLEGLLVLIPFGIAVAWVRDRTDSVFPGMLIHAVFNGLALALSVA
jgi:membrane protease YdiL (CAAX protease family)